MTEEHLYDWLQDLEIVCGLSETLRKSKSLVATLVPVIPRSVFFGLD